MDFGRDDVVGRKFGGSDGLMRDLVVSWSPRPSPSTTLSTLIR